MYAGAALGRVGLDFRPALPPLFESRILALFTQVHINEQTCGTSKHHPRKPPSSNCRPGLPALPPLAEFRIVTLFIRVDVTSM